MANERRRVLVVDDDAVTLRYTADILGQLGWAAYICVDAETARGSFERNGPFALAVVDVLLPGIRGTVFALELLDADPNLRVIVVSSRATSPPDDPRSRFLEKPFSPHALAALVAELVPPG